VTSLTLPLLFFLLLFFFSFLSNKFTTQKIIHKCKLQEIRRGSSPKGGGGCQQEEHRILVNSSGATRTSLYLPNTLAIFTARRCLQRPASPFPVIAYRYAGHEQKVESGRQRYGAGAEPIT